jgi:anaerobic selenocysteine-containing dehydrogenase
MTTWQLIDETLKRSGLWDAETNWARGGQDCSVSFERSRYADGFAWPDRRFRFKPDWQAFGGRWQEMPVLPDHMDVIDRATTAKPFRLVAAPARTFLNSTFTETPGSLAREKRPTARLNREDCAAMGIAEGDRVALANERGEVVVHALPCDGQQRGVVIVEGIWPNRHFESSLGINALTSADPGWPNGGAVFHDTAVAVRLL